MRFLTAAVALIGGALLASNVTGQEPDSLAATSQDTTSVPSVDAPPVEVQPSSLGVPVFGAPDQTNGIGPGGAFWRSMLIPGWGQSAIGEHSRGAFYFVAATGIGFMIFKSVSNRGAAQRVRDARAVGVVESLRVAGTPEDSIPIQLLEDPLVIEAQDLTDTRSQQVQDWIAAGLFLLLLSGADAFVSAHLIDFPDPLEIQMLPSGRMELGISLPMQGPGG